MSLPGSHHCHHCHSEKDKQLSVLCHTARGSVATGHHRHSQMDTLSSAFPGRAVRDSVSCESIYKDVWDNGVAPTSGVAWGPRSSAPTKSNTEVFAAKVPYPSTYPCVHLTFPKFSLCEITLHSPPSQPLKRAYSALHTCTRVEDTPRILPESVLPTGMSVCGCTSTHMQEFKCSPAFSPSIRLIRRLKRKNMAAAQKELHWQNEQVKKGNITVV